MTTRFVRKAIADRLEKVVRLLTAVAEKGAKNVERIHQLRTESRRADAALRLFGDWLPKRRADSIRQQFRHIRRKAGDVRDWDVAQECLGRLVPELSHEIREWVLDSSAAMRKKRATSLRRSCQRLVHRGLTEKMQSIGGRARWRSESTKPGIQEMTQSAIDLLGKELNDAVEAIPLDAPQLHKVRIASRRTRYTLELLKDRFPTFAFEAAVKNLIELQESIGQSNDQFLTLRLLQTLIAAGEQGKIGADLRQAIQTLEVKRMTSIVDDTKTRVENVQSALAELGKLCSHPVHSSNPA